MAEKKKKKTKEQYIQEHIEDGSESVSFQMVDEATVARLQRNGDVKLPRKKVNVPKDERWNTKQLNSKLLAGIENGDSIPKIAQSLTVVIGNNMASTTRNARTMVTGAENAGRKDSYDNLADQGVVQKKVWIATADDRTRESHLELDGEEVDIDQPFSNGLMYPGDPAGDPEEVYNCRCSMRDHIVGFRRADGTISYVDGDRGETLHDEQIAAERENRGIETAAEPELKTSERPEGDGTYGEDQLGHKYTKEEYESRLEELNEYDKYHYHATTVNAISGIKSEGLKPHRGHAGEEVYMAKTKDSALEWAHNTSTGGTVPIRIKNTFLAKTDYLDYDKLPDGEGSTSSIIPVKELEVLTSDGKWIPIKDAVVSYSRGVPSVIRRPR